MAKHFHKAWSKEDTINDILEFELEIKTDNSDFDVLLKALNKLTKKELGKVYHYIRQIKKEK